MCLLDRQSFSKVDGVEAPYELPHIILDKIGQITYNPIHFFSQVPSVGKYFRGQIVSYHDLCEDG